MGATESKQKLGERVIAAQTKLTADLERERVRFEYLQQHSTETLKSILDSVRASFETSSPFLESTLLIAWMHDAAMCEEIVLGACKKALQAPIDKAEYAWFKQYVFSSSVWFFKSSKDDSRYLYQDLLQIARTMSSHIVQEMDGIYDHLKTHRKWAQLQAIDNQTLVARQDHASVGLLQELGIRRILERKNDDDDDADNEQHDDMRSFVGSTLALNNLTSTASKINSEFQQYMRLVLKAHGEFQEAPMKQVERAQSKVENDYYGEPNPASARLLDVVRCSVTFNTVDQLLKGYQALIQHMQVRADIVELARVKNGFLERDDDEGGYRDIKVNIIFKSQNPEHADVKMICEVQLLLVNYLQEKKKIHKLYSIAREETFFEMVVQTTAAAERLAEQDVKSLQFTPVLNVGKEVTLEYQEKKMWKCTVHPELKLLAMEGSRWKTDDDSWFGVVDLVSKTQLFQVLREYPSIYHTHRWIVIGGEQYLSVQTKSNQIQMFKVSGDRQSGGFEFIDDPQYTLTVDASRINYCEFDQSFEHVLLVLDYTVLQRRTIKQLQKVEKSIVFQHRIGGTNLRDVRISDDGTRCVLGGGGGKKCFYIINVETEEQIKVESEYLKSCYAPCFINGGNEQVAFCGVNGKLEIWDLDKRESIKTIQTDGKDTMSTSTSTNNILAVGSFDRKLRLFDVRTWKCFSVKEFDLRCYSLDLTSDSKYVTVAGIGGDRCVVLQIE